MGRLDNHAKLMFFTVMLLCFVNCSHIDAINCSDMVTAFKILHLDVNTNAQSAILSTNVHIILLCKLLNFILNFDVKTFEIFEFDSLLY